MDKRAATIAGLFAAIISLLVGMGLLQFLHDNAMGLPRLLATVVLGRDALDRELVTNSEALSLVWRFISCSVWRSRTSSRSHCIAGVSGSG